MKAKNNAHADMKAKSCYAEMKAANNVYADMKAKIMSQDYFSFNH